MFEWVDAPIATSQVVVGPCWSLKGGMLTNTQNAVLVDEDESLHFVSSRQKKERKKESMKAESTPLAW